MAAERITLSNINSTSNSRDGRLFLETHLKNEGKEGFTLKVLDGENVWEGILSEDDLDQQCEKLKMDFETYVKETKAAFTQENTADQNFECHFKPAATSSQLSWKKIPTHDIKYNLGSVNLKKCSSTASNICDVLGHCIDQVHALQARVKSLETDNERLSLERQNALTRLEKCVTAKEELEKDLYSKFVLVLNSKKARIRQLKEELQEVKSLHDSPVPSTSREDSSSLPRGSKTATNRNGVAVKKKIESESKEYDAATDDDEESPPKKQQKEAPSKKKQKEESFLKLSEDDEESEPKMAPVARRPQRQRATKKQTPVKPTLPRVSSGGAGARPGSAGRESSLRKSGSGASNKSSDNIDPDDLIDNF